MKKNEFVTLFERLQNIPRHTGIPLNCILRHTDFTSIGRIVFVTNNGRTIFDSFSLEGKLFGTWGKESLDDLHAMYSGRTTLFRRPLSFVNPRGVSYGEDLLRKYMQSSFEHLKRSLGEGYPLLLSHKGLQSGYEFIAMPARKMCEINMYKETKV